MIIIQNILRLTKSALMLQKPQIYALSEKNKFLLIAIKIGWLISRETNPKSLNNVLEICLEKISNELTMGDQ